MTKKFLFRLVSLSLILTLCLCAVGCGGEKNSDYKLAFQIKIYGHGEEPGVYVLNDAENTLHIELAYTGEKRYVSFDSWCIPSHPQKEYNKEWNAARDWWVFEDKCDSNLYFIEEDGSLTPIKDKALKEKGHYVFVCEATEPSTLWKHQSKELYIDIV